MKEASCLYERPEILFTVEVQIYQEVEGIANAILSCTTDDRYPPIQARATIADTENPAFTISPGSYFSELVTIVNIIKSGDYQKLKIHQIELLATMIALNEIEEFEGARNFFTRMMPAAVGHAQAFHIGPENLRTYIEKIAKNSDSQDLIDDLRVYESLDEPTRKQKERLEDLRVKRRLGLQARQLLVVIDLIHFVLTRNPSLANIDVLPKTWPEHIDGKELTRGEYIEVNLNL